MNTIIIQVAAICPGSQGAFFVNHWVMEKSIRREGQHFLFPFPDSFFYYYYYSYSNIQTILKIEARRTFTKEEMDLLHFEENPNQVVQIAQFFELD